MTERALISIVLPVSNQSLFIQGTIDSYEESLKKLERPHELILVENASRDATFAVCQRLAERYPTIRLLRSNEAGWGRAVRMGLRESRGGTLCYTNSARTGTRDLLVLLLYASVYPEAVIKASRERRDSWKRRLGSILYNIECRALFDLPYGDVNATPKIFPRKFDKLLALARNDDLIDVEFAVTCRREGYPMIEVPVASTRRHGGRSTTDYRSAWRMYRGAVAMWRAMRREGVLRALPVEH